MKEDDAHGGDGEISEKQYVPPQKVHTLECKIIQSKADDEREGGNKLLVPFEKLLGTPREFWKVLSHFYIITIKCGTLLDNVPFNN